MITRLLTPFLLAGAAASAIALAPTAGAGSPVSCEERGPTAVCSRPGHNSIYTAPSQDTLGQMFMIGPGNTLPVPPMLAMN